MKNTAILTVLYIIFLQNGVFAQIGLSLETESGYASNSFANYRMLPDYYFYLSSRVTYDRIAGSHGFRAFYKGYLNTYKVYRDRNFSDHTIGLTVFKNLTKYKLNAGIQGSGRYFGDSYRWYERRQLYAYVNMKAVLFDQLYGYAGINIRLKDYPYLQPFSHWQNVWFIRLSRFFDTGTTVIAESDLLLKEYVPENTMDSVDELPEIVTLGDGGSQQWVALIRGAQSLTSKTGVNAQLLLRRNIKSSVRYMGSMSGVYYSDEELFDDIFGYNAEQFSLTLRQMLPWRTKLSLGSTWIDKKYDKRLALDLDGTPYPDGRLRSDRRWIHWISIEKSLSVLSTQQPVIFSVDWTLLHNNSNDPFYDYSSNYFTFGISQNF